MPSKIFISSTIDDLQVERKKIADVIVQSENLPIMSENIIDVKKTPRKVIEEKIKECNGYIGIFHKKWGYVPENDNPELLSITAIEYEMAKTLGLPRLILISNHTKESQLEDFIKKITKFEDGQWRAKYNDITDLVREVAISIPALISNMMSKRGYPNHLESAMIVDTGDLSLRYNEKDQKWYILYETGQIELVRDYASSNVTDVLTKLLSETKTVFLIGPHGIGKSILARYIMAQIIRSNIPIVSIERLNLENIREVLDIAQKEKLPVLYDPMSPTVYEDRNEIQGLEFQNLEKNMVGIVKEVIQSNASAFIVLPTDLFEKVRAHLSTSDYKTVNLENYVKHESFLKTIIRVYAENCNVPKDSQILDEFINKLQVFDDGYTLIAAYVGRWLKKNNCNAKNVEEALNQAKGKPIRFLQNYLWAAIMNRDHRLAGDVSLPLIIHAVMGAIPINLAKEIPLSLPNANFHRLSPDLAEWISRQHEHLMEMAIKNLVISASRFSTDPSYPNDRPELRELYSIIKDVIDEIENAEELQKYPFVDYKITGYVQRWLAKKVNEKPVEQSANLLNLCSRNILLSYADIDVSSNLITKYLMIGNKLPYSSSVILKGVPGKINDILELLIHPEIDYCNQLSYPLNTVRQTGTLNEDTYIDMLGSILGIGIQENVDVECLINALYGITITSNTFPYLAQNIYWQTGIRLIVKANKLIEENNQVAIILSHYLKSLIENKINEPEVFQSIISVGQIQHWIVPIIISKALIHHAIVTHNKNVFSSIVQRVKNYVSLNPSTGLILIAEIGPKLLEACETFGEPEGVEYWYNETKNSIDELRKWGDANPDLREYLEYYHHFGHFENKRRLDNIDIDVLEMRGRILFRNNKLRNAERNLEKMLTLARENNLRDEDRLLWLEFKLVCLKKLRSGLQDTDDLNRIWEKTLRNIRFLGRIAFINIMSMYVVFSNTPEAKRILTQFGYVLVENNSIALLTYGFFLVQNNDYLTAFWDHFTKFLKLYATERLNPNSESIENLINNESLNQMSRYPEIMQIASSLLNNSSGLVGLILYGYLKKDQILVQQLLNYAIKKFGYIKIMQSICKNLLNMIKLGKDIDSPEFQNKLLRLYFMRIM